MARPYSFWPVAVVDAAEGASRGTFAAASQTSGKLAAALQPGCAPDLQPGPVVHRIGAGSSAPGTVAAGLRTAGSYCRSLFPSCRAARQIGRLAAVHGDASFPGS
uniref:Uncharacterized protein n=1 Tax=Arundo donax TaxID=35708 RepID=A0A0A9GG24_ARUDO